ncbi:MAG: hypothetical protein Q4D04_11855, partial [Clostridia bacterium]|nr:hypothetical protein [Clostridia bacterium]
AGRSPDGEVRLSWLKAARSAKERWQGVALTERFLSRQQGITLTERFPRMASDRAKLRDRGVNLLGLMTLSCKERWQCEALTERLARPEPLRGAVYQTGCAVDLYVPPSGKPKAQCVTISSVNLSILVYKG